FRVVVDAADDQRLLDAPGDVQLAVVEESEVAGAETRARRTSQPGVEGAVGLRWIVPIAQRDAVARHPDLADMARTARRAARRIDDLDALSTCRVPAADQHTTAGAGVDEPH